MNLNRKRRERGFSLIELLIVISIILVILAIALPNFRRASLYSHETAAPATIRTLHQAEAQYFGSYGRYAASLQELGKPASGSANATAADLIGGDLAKGEKSGYRYTLRATPEGYQINADPIAFGTTGTRTFYSDQGQEIHVHSGREPATAGDPEMK